MGEHNPADLNEREYDQIEEEPTQHGLSLSYKKIRKEVKDSKSLSKWTKKRIKDYVAELKKAGITWTVKKKEG